MYLYIVYESIHIYLSTERRADDNVYELIIA